MEDKAQTQLPSSPNPRRYAFIFSLSFALRRVAGLIPALLASSWMAFAGMGLGRVLILFKVDEGTSNKSHGFKITSQFFKTCSNTTKMLQSGKKIFHQVS